MMFGDNEAEKQNTEVKFKIIGILISKNFFRDIDVSFTVTFITTVTLFLKRGKGYYNIDTGGVGLGFETKPKPRFEKGPTYDLIPTST